MPLKTNINSFVAIFFILTLAAGVGFFSFWTTTSGPMSDLRDVGGEQVFCTQDAKQCPDGSYVSRTGPNCEFTACATPDKKPPINNKDDLLNWQTYRNEEYGFEVKYPGDWHIGTSDQGDVVRFENTDIFEKPSDCDEVLSVEIIRDVSLAAALQEVLFQTKTDAFENLKMTWEDNPEWVKEQSDWIKTHDAPYYIFGGILDPGVSAVEKIYINGHEAFKASSWARCYYDEGGIAGSGEAARYLILGNPKTYAILYVFGGDQGAVSTFRFTN